MTRFCRVANLWAVIGSNFKITVRPTASCREPITHSCAVWVGDHLEFDMRDYQNGPMRSYARWEQRMWRRAELSTRLQRLAKIAIVGWLVFIALYVAL